MVYEGIKFKTKKIEEDLPNDSRIDRLKYWCNIFHEKGLAPPYEGGSYGNLSFRLNNSENFFIITASQSGLNESQTNDRFVTVSYVDLKAGIVYFKGIREPSSEAILHYVIYQARPDVQAVFHGHCEKISRNAKKLGLPITSKEEPYGTIDLAERVLETLNDFYFLEMKNHGFLSFGKSLDEAGNQALKFFEKCSKSQRKISLQGILHPAFSWIKSLK